MKNDSEKNSLLEGLTDYYSEEKDNISDEQARVAIDAMNVIMHDLQNVTEVIVKKYPFLVPFMEEKGCNNVSEGEEISKLDQDALNVTGNMKYYDWDHLGIRYFIVSNNWEKIEEVPWRIWGEIEYLPENIIDYREITVNQAVNESSEFLITYLDDADVNQKHMVISKLI